MTDRNPADTLTAAAQRLREAAGDAVKASPLPWFIDTGNSSGAGVIYSDEYSNIVADRSCDSAEDATDLPYIALMHPGVGLALADLLASCARYAEANDIGPADLEDDPEFCRALTLGRALLGEVTE